MESYSQKRINYGSLTHHCYAVKHGGIHGFDMFGNTAEVFLLIIYATISKQKRMSITCFSAVSLTK